MDILIDHGSMRFDNLGDIAMLQTCVGRLTEYWPNARLRVLTHDPDALTQHMSGVESLHLHSSNRWLRLRTPLTLLARLLPGSLAGRLEARAALSLPSGYRRTIADAVEASDLYVHAGAGILTDVFPSAAGRRLSSIDSAIDHGVPTVLFGQGIGPLKLPALKRRAQSVLPRVNLIGTRDMDSLTFAAETLAVSPDRMHMTGDDALEIGFEDHPSAQGHGLGINIRVSRYSAIRPADRVWLVDQLQPLAVDSPIDQTTCVPLAIHPMDRRATEWVLARLQPGRPPEWHDHAVPGLVRSIGRCQLVICTSYHAAVLALAQGIPAICLYRSSYYRRKFGGLCDLFPAACRRIDLGRSEDRRRFADTAQQLLEDSPQRRAETIRSVQDQIDRSKNLYQRASELLMDANG